jgi:uncharacterized protein (TIGR03435 family)
MTREEYLASPAASAPLEERMASAASRRICGLVSIDGVSASVTFAQLARHVSTCCDPLDAVVIDRTGVEGPLNFEIRLGPRSEGSLEERFARAVEPLGLRLERIKAPAEYLLIESVQRLRPNEPS